MAETGRTLTHPKRVGYQRQNAPGMAYPVCIQLPACLDAMVAREDLKLELTPLFALGGPHIDPDRYILRRQRYILNGIAPDLALTEGQGALFDAVIDHVVHGKHNEVAILPWERVICSNTQRRRIRRANATFLRFFTPVRQFEERIGLTFMQGEPS